MEEVVINKPRNFSCFKVLEEGKLEKNDWIGEIEGFYDEDSE